MNYSKLDNCGLSISKLSIGSMHIKDKYVYKDVLNYALENGINYIDTSDGYLNGESLSIIGDILSKSSLSRDQYLIGSKAFFSRGNSVLQNGLNRKNILESVNLSLKKLKTNYLDFFFLHRYDDNTPVDNVLDTLNILISQGKILNWGVSGFSTYQLCEIYFKAAEKRMTLPALAQYPYNLFNRSIESEIEEAFKKMNIPLISYYPLSQGVLTGKYIDNIPHDSRAFDSNLKLTMWDLKESNDLKVKQFIDFSFSKKISPTHVAMKWCLKNKNVKSILTNFSTIDQIKESIDFSNLILSKSDLEEIDNIFKE